MNMNLFNGNSRFLDRFFRKVDGLVWDITTGKLGVQSDGGIITLELTPAAEGARNAEPTAQVSINPFDQFGIAIPAFATNTNLEQIEVGDLIVGAKEVLGWVIKKNAASLVLLDTKGFQKQYNPPKVAVINQSGAMVVKNLTGLLGDTGAQGFQSALLPLLIMGGDSGLDFEKLIPLMLFSQQGQGGAAGSGIAGMLPTLMMMGALGGSNSSTPGIARVTTGAPPLTRNR
jgi:hypothetical protein